MAVICYGLDCSLRERQKLKGLSLSKQKTLLEEHLGDRFNPKAWFGDLGTEIANPFQERPKGFLATIKLSPGAELWADTPERIFTAIQPSKRLMLFLHDLGVTVHTLAPGFETINIDRNQIALVASRYIEMLHSIGFIPGGGKKPGTNDSVPIGWSVTKKPAYQNQFPYLIPNMPERMLAKVVYDAIIDNFLTPNEVTVSLRVGTRKVIPLCEAYEQDFPIRTRTACFKRPIMGEATVLPNIRHILTCLSFRPMTIREIAAECCLSPFHAYTVLKRILFYTELRFANMWNTKGLAKKKPTMPKGIGRTMEEIIEMQAVASLPSVPILQCDRTKPHPSSNESELDIRKVAAWLTFPAFNRPIRFYVTDEWRSLVQSGSPLIDYWMYADIVNEICDSYHTFLGLDGADDQVLVDSSSLSAPVRDLPETLVGPSRPRDPALGRFDEEGLPLLDDSHDPRTNSSAPCTPGEYR